MERTKLKINQESSEAFDAGQKECSNSVASVDRLASVLSGLNPSSRLVF